MLRKKKTDAEKNLIRGRGKQFLAVTIAVVFVVLITSVLNFKNNLDNSLRENAVDRLMDIAEGQRELVQAHMSGMIRELEFTASSMPDFDPASEKTKEHVASAIKLGHFNQIVVCDMDGVAWNSTVNWENGKVSYDEDALEAAKDGRHFVSMSDGDVHISTSINDGVEIKGMITGSYPAARITEYANDHVRKYNSCVFIARKTGEILTSSGNINTIKIDQMTLDEFFKTVVFINGDKAEDVWSDMEVEVRDNVMLQLGRQKLLMAYTPMEISDWYIFTITPYKMIENDISSISRDAYDISLKLCIAFTLLIAYLLADNRRQVETLREQQKEMRASAVRYKLITERSKDVILEYDMRKDLMVHCENGGILGSPEMRSINVVQNMIERGIVYPEDAGLFHDSVDKAGLGVENVEVDLRLKLNMSGYNWYRLDMVCINDDEGNPWHVVARATNIDQQKREQQQLQQRAVCDPLTKLYNKGATRSEIDSILEKNTGFHSLMIMDVDNFKQFNDNYGHMFGDQVLQRAAESITHIFRSSDVAGRIGGDEFMIFCRDIGNRTNAARRAQQVCDLFKAVGGELDPPVETSCSVGVAFYPEDGDSFDKLYANADRALYSMKKTGKGSYAIFNRETMGEGAKETKADKG